MPTVCEFFGISIYVYYDDHGPPHFHAMYAEAHALIAIADLAVLRGSLPPRALGLVIEWATLHQDQLMAVWTRAERHEPLGRIEPLR